MRSRRLWVSVATVVAGCLLATACTSRNSSVQGAGGAPAANTTANAPTSSAPSSSAPVPAALISITPKSGSTAINPASPIKVGVTDGTLSEVSLVNAAGRHVKGALSADKTLWQASEVLGYGKTYKLTTKAVNAAGVATTKVASFSTLEPDNMTMPYFETTGGSLLTNGATYGVGLVVNVHFDEAIPDKRAAEKALVVTTTPAVKGAWYWLDDQNVHWRPQAYYKPGTKVTVAAKVYGVNVGNGLYGQSDASTSFTIGASHISIADDNTKMVVVRDNGKVVRTMPTSMGKGGTQTIGTHVISYWTQRGTYTVLDKQNPVLMDSTTYGLPYAKGGYKEYINWATRISTDGVYLHELTATIWAQGNTDTSHGCLNLNPTNAKWFYNFSQIGDVVVVKHTGGSPLEVWQNGDWSVPWSTWVKGGDI